MDRFVHSLVEGSGGPATTSFSSRGEAEDDLSGYDDLPRSTAVDAFIVTDTYLGNPQAVWLRQRRAPFVGIGPARWVSTTRRHPWVDVDGAAGADLATTSPAPPRPRADRLDLLAQGLADRR